MNKTLLVLGSAAMLLGGTAVDSQAAGHKKGRHMDHMRAHDHGDIMRRLDGLERDAVAREELLQARINQLQEELEGLRTKEMNDVKKLWRTRPDARTERSGSLRHES